MTSLELKVGVQPAEVVVVVPEPLNSSFADSCKISRDRLRCNVTTWLIFIMDEFLTVLSVITSLGKLRIYSILYNKFEVRRVETWLLEVPDVG